MVLALALSACGKQRAAEPASRAQACAAALDPSLVVGGLQFCQPGGAECDPALGSGFSCQETSLGEQRVCARDRTNVPAGTPLGTCEPGSSAGCFPLVWLQCRAYTPSGGGTAYGCFPGPSCSSATDAGADQ